MEAASEEAVGISEGPKSDPLKGLLGSEEGKMLRRVMFDSNPHSLVAYLASEEARPIRRQVGSSKAPARLQQGFTDVFP